MLQLVSHPILPHSSTPLLFFYLSSLILSFIRLRTSLVLAHGSPSHLSAARLALFIFLTIKLASFGILFLVELMGPTGWDGMTARDWVSWIPGVKARDEGKIKLVTDEDGNVEGEDEWKHEPCPRLRANIFSRLTFSWMTPMMKTGYKKFLTEEDLWALPPDDTAEALGKRLESAWESRKKALQHKQKDAKQNGAKTTADNEKEPKPNLTGALVSAYGGPFFAAAVFKVCSGQIVY